MTPCEKLGYKVGDRFEVVGVDEDIDPIFHIGTIIELIRDDGSSCPRFKFVDGEKSSYLIKHGSDDHYFELDDIRLITPERNGEGLPPVGTVCEFGLSNMKQVGKVVCHVTGASGMKFAVFQVEEGGWVVSHQLFSPIKPKKTEAELMEEIFNKAGIQGLIDAGYHK